MKRLLLAFTLLLFPFLIAFGQAAQGDTTSARTDNTIKLFLDCNRCNETYIRTNIPFINFVRNKRDSDVHLLITRERTASGGTRFILKYLGREQFDQQNDTLDFISQEYYTEDQERRALVKHIKAGVLPYVFKVADINNFDINYTEPSEQVQTTAQQDKWNNWIFEIDLRTFFSGEETRKSYFISGGASAERVTEEWKITSFYRRSYDLTRIERDGDTDDFVRESQFFDGLVAKSLSPHWSLGIFLEGRSSTRDNLDISLSGSPVVEFSVFPYSEFNEREITFQYGIAPVYNNYTDSTIFNETRQLLIESQLRGDMEFTQPWGEIEGGLNVSAFLHDLSKNRVGIDLEFDIRVSRGFSVNLSGRYSLINNQIFLSKEGTTTEEELLNLRQRATSFSFRGSIGFEYNFGSIYNNVVNPRF